MASPTTENNTQELIGKALSQAISYEDYRAMVNQLALEGKATGPEQSEALANYTMLNDRRMKRFDKTVKVSEEAATTIARLDKRVQFIVLTESWCGDAAPALPVINKVAELNDNIDLKVVLRDENISLMNRFLTNGGMSIPKLIVWDAENQEVLADWGPRPEPAAKLVADHKEKHGKLLPEIKEEIQQWYNKDKGQTTLKELLTRLPLK
ncbi:thioredoxin family protein [Zobellia uliginosa]|mgnify:CR=1 FL=1|uniref:thioredoxin family protein n=1 Tax=Zobellia uliginosa TaxID=143224 RepID=UPI001C07C450|nr:thioredoxin family protein [Zobellia uliginosa]MBU2947874.1 thioredoxin family protein [Zobellia uliginosa]